MVPLSSMLLMVLLGSLITSARGYLHDKLSRANAEVEDPVYNAALNKMMVREEQAGLPELQQL